MSARLEFVDEWWIPEGLLPASGRGEAPTYVFSDEDPAASSPPLMDEAASTEARSDRAEV